MEERYYVLCAVLRERVSGGAQVAIGEWRTSPKNFLNMIAVMVLLRGLVVEDRSLYLTVELGRSEGLP